MKYLRLLFERFNIAIGRRRRFLLITIVVVSLLISMRETASREIEKMCGENRFAEQRNWVWEG